MTADILKSLIAMNLAAAGAIVILLLAGSALRRAFGSRIAYAAWLVIPLAAAATFLPARASLPIAPAPLRPMAEATVVLLSDTAPAFDWTVAAITAWAIGAIALISLTVWTQWRTMALIGRLTPEGRLVRAANPAIGPAILGILRPRIMVPADFEHRFDAAEQAIIMAHEENHIAHGDARINAAIELVRCLFWFNPLIHVAARRIRTDQELACDAAVIARFPKARRTYAEALLKSQTASAPLPLGCYWPERSHKALKERLTMLTLKTPGRARRIAGAACLTALGLGTGYAAWAAAPETVAMPTPEPAPLAAATLAPEPAPTPTPAPAPQSLTNAAPPPALGFVPVEPDENEDRTEVFVRVPLTEGAVPGSRAFSGTGRTNHTMSLALPAAGDQMAVRIECRKHEEGPTTCLKDGVAVEGAELARLQAMFAAGAPGGGGDATSSIQLRRVPAGEGRTVISIQGRRPAE